MIKKGKLNPMLFLGFLSMVVAACAPLAVQNPVGSPTAEDPTDDASEPAASPTHADEAQDRGDPFEGVNISFSKTFWLERTNFYKHSVDLSEIFTGNPIPDAIPAIDNPVFENVEDADVWLGEDWPVMLFELDGDVRAYPLAILIWHEIVNDVVAGEPVAVTFCPLCNATIAFRRTLDDGKVLDFGTSGNLRNSDLVMYDRQTFSWWQQFTGEAIVGDLTGTVLDFLPSQIIAWSDFKDAHPDGRVLSRDTGAVRTYGVNPYAGYDSVNSSPFFPVEGDDDRLLPMERVVAVEFGDITIAYPFTLLEDVRVVNDEIEGEPIVIIWQAGTVSAFGNNGPDTGSTGVFSRDVERQTLTFVAKTDGFEDEETGTRWNLLGHAVAGPLEGAQLERIVSGEHFWFSWAAFKPETEVWSAP
ncbi:MAG: DUF3179 domain-containing protein [Anaerolineales bacterium]